MARYIELDALLAEIERLACQEYNSLCEKLLDYIDTTEVKNVNLDFTKEVDMWVMDNGDTNGFFNVQDLAKYFFELGLKAQKGE